MFTTCNNKGFTLVETVIAMFLGVAVSIAAVSVFVSGLEHIREARQFSYLQSNASYLSNTLDYWIKQGEGLELADSSTLKIILPGSEKTVALTGDDITIDGVAFNDEKVEVLSLNFNKLVNSVQVSFVLKAKNSSQSLSLQTTITKRNIYAN